jgi:hypothetical protein
MRTPGFIIGTLLALVLVTAPARATTLDYQGYAFETGDFPPSVAGDTLRIPIVVTALAQDLGIDLGTEEVTGWIDGLVSSGPQDGGDAVMFFTFSTGRIEFYRDALSDHAFEPLPPNAAVPSTFTNGTLCLAGTISDFILYLDTDTNSGAYEGNVVFDAGDCLATLQAQRAEGYTFGGVMTRAVLGNTVPQGYGFSVDGYLEAQKVPVGECPLACIGLTAARLDFPRRPPRHFGPRDGKFRIDGVFLPCADFGPLDPSLVEVRVRIGGYEQIFPEGALVLEEDFDDPDIEWEFKNPHGTETITELELEIEADGVWEFEILGRGIPRSTLLGEDNLLVVELTVGPMNGTAQAPLVQKRSKLRYEGPERPCQPPLAVPQEGIATRVEPEETLLAAGPNPVHDAATFALRTASAGDVRLHVFDVRGRLVRSIQSGWLPAGRHDFSWDARDASGAPVAAGVYLYRAEGPGLAASRKLVVAR